MTFDEDFDTFSVVLEAFHFQQFERPNLMRYC